MDETSERNEEMLTQFVGFTTTNNPSFYVVIIW